jgi:hypothetical protein
MQRAVSWLPSWDKTKTTSKKGFDKTWAWADKLGAPVNRLTNKIGSEAFWPVSLLPQDSLNDTKSDNIARQPSTRNATKLLEFLKHFAVSLRSTLPENQFIQVLPLT